MKKALYVFFLLLSTTTVLAQIQLVPYTEVEVKNDGESFKSPWAGGFNSPQFSQIDLNNDGKMDLVVFERDFYGSLKTFINTGTNGESSYEHVPKWQSVFPPMRNWMLLRDFNCDGLEDIFTSVPGGVMVYRNVGAIGGTPSFKLESTLLLSGRTDDPTPLYVAVTDIPAITDIDGDGDLDILSFNIIGNTMQFHQNLSMENYGNCEELEFELANPCWGYFSEDGNNNTVSLFDTCEVNETTIKAGKHAGSTVLAIDLTGNGAKDLLLGDISYNNLVWLENGGDTDEAIMVDQETSFPANSLAVDITVFPAAYSLDVNNDNLKDLVVAPNNPNTSENYNNIWYYRNTGNNSVPVFEFITDKFLFDETIDLGERSYPAFLDENADGLMDIIAGSFGYFEAAGSYSSRLMLLRNTGTTSEPQFELISDDYAGLGEFGFDGVFPAFGDLDGDGDKDMIIGDEEGKLHLFTNEAGAGNPADFNLTGPNYFNIDVGESARPQIYDVNGDGLPDLLSGERSGKVRYYENSGTEEIPVFSQAATSDSLGNIDVMPDCCSGFSAPFMTKDSAGNTILYVGSEQGYLYLYNNIDGNLSGSFNLLDSLYLYGSEVNISGADINNENGMEFVCGLSAGGIQLLKGGEPFVFGKTEHSLSEGEVHIYPNPAGELLNIEIRGQATARPVKLSIFNLYGQMLYRGNKQFEEKKYSVNIQKLVPGAYFLRIESGRTSINKKFIKVK